MTTKQHPLSPIRPFSPPTMQKPAGRVPAWPEAVTRVDTASEARTAQDRSSEATPPARSNLEGPAQNPETRIVAALRQAGYQVERIEFQLDDQRATPGDEPRMMVTYVDRPLAGHRMDQIERRAILETLKACGGNQAQASRLLGISEKTIYNKLRQYRRRTPEC